METHGEKHWECAWDITGCCGPDGKTHGSKVDVEAHGANGIGN